MKDFYRVLHVADIHLDSALGVYNDKLKAKQRNNEILESFRRMVEWANENEVDSIIIAGDLFDTRNPSVRTRKYVLDLIKEHSSMAFFYLRGNHDSDGFLEWLQERPSNLFVFSDSWTRYVLYDGDITGQGRSIVLYGMELNSGNRTDFNKLLPAPEDYNIVTLHGQETTYKDKDKTEVVAIPEFRNRNIDYMALGHLHTYKEAELDARGRYCYTGCFEPRGFDELGDHYAKLITIGLDGFRADIEDISFETRHSFEVIVDASECYSESDLFKVLDIKILESGCRREDMVKLTVTGLVDADVSFDTGLIFEHYRERFFSVKVKDETEVKLNIDQYIHDRSLKGEFIRLVLKSDQIPESKKSDVIRTGLAALAGTLEVGE